MTLVEETDIAVDALLSSRQGREQLAVYLAEVCLAKFGVLEPYIAEKLALLAPDLTAPERRMALEQLAYALRCRNNALTRDGREAAGVSFDDAVRRLCGVAS